MAKWLAAFMDEGLAEWEMPNKTKGFITLGANWRYDTDMPKRLLAKSQNKTEALAAIMDGYSSTDFTKIFTWH
jgi:uncharacterized protein YbcC (UPF0753/DUF2309 family)